MAVEALKEKVWQTIDAHKDRIIGLGESLYAKPELGYRERFATDTVAAFFRDLGLFATTDIAVTGCFADFAGKESGPVIAVMGEMDAIVCREHPDADSISGAVHACGHHIQIAAMAGCALGLVLADVAPALSGIIRFLAVPAEEFVELPFRESLRKKGKIRFFGGKQEMIAKGLFHDVDMAMMVHALDLGPEHKVLIGPDGNGFMAKEIRFTGKEAHAGSAPETGVNALNAAMLAMNAIHAQRETFREADRIRVHPILTKGGDVVNVVPADVRMETFVRGRTIAGILDASAKVDRALQAGAMAVGASVAIRNLPGYLPLLHTPELDAIYRENANTLAGEAAVLEGGDFTGSFDFGDLSHLMPTLHPFSGGVEGGLHTGRFQVTDPETAFLLPAKLMAATLLDLLTEKGAKAKQVMEHFTPAMTTKDYLVLLDQMTTPPPA